MIKRLRIQFVCVTMALTTVLLLTIMVLICYNTWYEMDHDIHEALRTATFDRWHTDRQWQPASNRECPCFMLFVSGDGTLHATGHNIYNLSDTEELMVIFQEAKATGKTEGFLTEHNLRFVRNESWGAQPYFVFTDVSRMFATMRSLYVSCSISFLVAFAIFFASSCLVSKWMVRPLERAWAHQRQFVADASHELKTPLTVILTNAEMLQDPDFDESNRQRHTQSIHTMAHQMKDLVENLLELARVDYPQTPKRAEFQTVDFSFVAEECALRFEPVYFETGRSLESRVQPGLQVKGMEGNLRQVVDILLDNGTKYALPGSEVTLTLEQSRGNALLKVITQGESLTPEQCEDIFKRFYRMDTVRTMSHSYGLGLPIALGIVQKHRGKIWCQSKDGVNTFLVSLPLCHHK